MNFRHLVLPVVLLFAGCHVTEEQARAQAVRRQQREWRKTQETFVQGREGEEERIALYKEAQLAHDELLKEAKHQAADYARENAGEIAYARDEQAKKDEAYRSFERDYARSLGKRPSQLTPEEKQAVHQSF